MNQTEQRLVARGNRVHYPGNTGTPTANLLTIKLLINSTISTAGVKFMAMDINGFCLNTPIAQYKYMRLKLTDIPANMIKHYNLHKIATPNGYGYVYCKIQKRHVRASPSGHNCPRTTHRPTETPWLLPKQNNTRTMDAQIPPHCFLPQHLHFWSKVHWQGKCSTPVGHNTKML
jgi:hypothetical protein